MRRSSYDSAQRPLSDVQYNQVNNGFNQYQPTRKSGVNKWIKIGVPVVIVVVLVAVLAGVFGSRAANKSKNNHVAESNSNSAASSEAAAQSSIRAELGRFATATDSYFNPVYPSTTNDAAFSDPTFIPDDKATLKWPKDDFVQSNPSFDNLRPHPRLIAPQYKWDALPDLIKADPYLKGWDEIIMNNATNYFNLPVVVHVFDGGPSASGILDPAREVKQRCKHFSYAYRRTGDTKWVDRLWRELQNAAGNGTDPWGSAPDNWNTAHFLDTAELAAGYAVAFDWVHDAWSPDQREQIKWSMINLALNYGLQALTTDSTTYGWWKTVNGNWNCVSNNGLIMASLAILDEDTSGVARPLLEAAVTNAANNCANGPSSDGTWVETANYHYFGMTGHAEAASSLMTATGGGEFGLLTHNPSFNLTSLYHMYVTGMTSLYNYGDHGPNKYTATANALFLYGDYYQAPIYQLFQRDRFDAAEPWSMFWYDPTVSGGFWTDLALDHVFEDPETSWGSFRTSWTDNTGIYFAMKASKLQGHQTHGDLDCGDFVLDALGERWAGELGSADYLGDGYFSNENQDSVRWLWYRKMTEGQNTLNIGGANQLVTAAPTIKWETSGTQQGSSTVLDIPKDSSAYMIADLSSAYSGANIRRGIRFLNARRQVLLQDEITNVDATVSWRMHTNATVTLDGTNATLDLNGKKLQVQLINPPSGVKFQTLDPVRTANAPQLQPGQEPDQPNPGVTVLAFDIPAGTNTIQVLFNPQYSDFTDFITPSAVALDSWTLDSH